MRENFHEPKKKRKLLNDGVTGRDAHTMSEMEVEVMPPTTNAAEYYSCLLYTSPSPRD